MELLKGFAVQEIRRQLDNGSRMAVVTPPNSELSWERVVGTSLSRWTKESYTKNMRAELNLDRLPEYSLLAVSADAEVVNPKLWEFEQEVRR